MPWKEISRCVSTKKTAQGVDCTLPISFSKHRSARANECQQMRWEYWLICNASDRDATAFVWQLAIARSFPDHDHAMMFTKTRWYLLVQSVTHVGQEPNISKAVLRVFPKKLFGRYTCMSRHQCMSSTFGEWVDWAKLGDLFMPLDFIPVQVWRRTHQGMIVDPVSIYLGFRISYSVCWCLSKPASCNIYFL